MDSSDTLLPKNLEAEQALLGALFHDNGLLEKVSDFLRPEHFSEPLHGRIFEAVVHFSQKGQMANPITLRNYFKEDEVVLEKGGEDYLVTLSGLVISFSNTADYGRQIYDLYLRRQLVYLGEEVIQMRAPMLLKKKQPLKLRVRNVVFLIWPPWVKQNVGFKILAKHCLRRS